MLNIQNKVEAEFIGLDSDINTIFFDAVNIDGVSTLNELKAFAKRWLGKCYDTEVLEFIIDMEK